MALNHQNKYVLPLQNGWTCKQLVHVLSLSKQLKEHSQKSDDDVDRSLKFCNEIDEVMNQYQLLLNQKEMHRRQLPITVFFRPLKFD